MAKRSNGKKSLPPVKKDAMMKKPSSGALAEVSAANLKKHTDLHRHVENFQDGTITADELQELIGNK